MSLTNENDLLETGVEIFAEPPGKKVQSMSLLSGGEKALTSISLLFALFAYRPASFCILDEVDAPLDEVNTSRYNNIIKEMASLSQFIVITHNKKTMEVAETLFGVTMQEPGVTQIVGVELQEARAFVASA
jgi:chromosome segregation protein